jgi:hypothetical protein
MSRCLAHTSGTSEEVVLLVKLGRYFYDLIALCANELAPLYLLLPNGCPRQSQLDKTGIHPSHPQSLLALVHASQHLAV